MATPIPANCAPLTARAAAAATGGRVARSTGVHRVARGITSDSRAVVEEGAFVALRGDRFDGHDYVDAAARAGAALVVVERGRGPSNDSVAVVEVDDTLVAWGELARAHVRAWRSPGSASDGAAASLAGAHGEAAPRRTIAITGSAGKTTTKELCAALARSLGGCHATIGNLNNRVGVPAMAFGLRDEHRFGVFEIGMSVRGEIAALSRILEPDVGVVTNVGIAHAAGVGGTRADVAQEKGALFAALPATGTAVACIDDAAAMQQLRRSRARAVTFGRADGADYRLVDRTATGADACELRVVRPLGRSPIAVTLPILGEAAALDFLAALAAVEAAIGAALSPDRISAALSEHLQKPPGRMQTRHLKSGVTILDDTYNANPESVRAALRTLGEVAAGKRAVVVLGEMRELGPTGAAEHAEVGSYVARSGARLLVSCGGLADRAAAEAECAGVRVIRAVDADDAARRAAEQVGPGDVVLVKASRSVGAERVVEALAAAGGGEATIGSTAH